MGLRDVGDAGLSECFLYDFSVPDSAYLFVLHTNPLFASILRLCFVLMTTLAPVRLPDVF